jgi:hypothetical protein
MSWIIAAAIGALIGVAALTGVSRADSLAGGLSRSISSAQ